MVMDGDRIDWAFVERILDVEAVRTIYLYGRPGVGKTYAAYHKGRRRRGLYAITLTQDTAAAELRGHWVPCKGDFVWKDGPFTAALREGARLVVNELSHAPPDVLALLHPVLESVETARLTLPTGETVQPAAGFHAICTDNQPPDELPEALRDRFDAVLRIDEPHPEALARLVPSLRRAALRTFDLEPERAVSLRDWLTIQKLGEALGMRDACTAVFGPERGRHIHDAIVLAGEDGVPAQGALL